MSRRVLVLRPEPGNAETCARAQAAGLTPIALPLFALTPRAWVTPDPRDHDALILTSANTVRLAGPQLAALALLPAYAVGEATAQAAHEAGLKVARTGMQDAAALIEAAAHAGVARALYLGAAETAVAPGGIIAAARTVYASMPSSVSPAQLAKAAADAIALLHSPRAAARFAALFGESGAQRDTVTVAALSPAVARAVGVGWARIKVAKAPTDAALIATID